MANLTLVSTSKSPSTGLGDSKFHLKGKNLHLSVEIRENIIVGAILDKDANQYVSFASYSRKPAEDDAHLFENIIREDLFTNIYSSTSIVFCHNSSILIPSAFFKKETYKDYLHQQDMVKPTEAPNFDYIKNLDSYNLYSVDRHAWTFFISKFPDAVFRHHSSIFIEYLLTLNKESKSDNVHIYVFPDYFDIAVLQAGKLILYNRFYYQTAEDFTYYIVWVFEQLKLDCEKLLCVFYGEIEDKSEAYKMVGKYIKNITKMTRNTRFTYTSMLESLSPHRYYSLFMQYLCI
jgi:hypothetical protein